MEYRFTLEDKKSIFGTFVLPESDAPVGWNDISIKMIRHSEFHGIFPEITSTLKFFCTGYDFIKNCYDYYGIDSEVIIYVDFFYNDDWRRFMEGKIDLTDCIFTYQFVEISIKPNNCIDLFLNRIDDSFDIFLDTCYDVLTADKTAVHTRYVYSPYRVKFKELEFVGQALIDMTKIDSDTQNYQSLGDIYWYYNVIGIPFYHSVIGFVCSSPPMISNIGNYILLDDYSILQSNFTPTLPYNQHNGINVNTNNVSTLNTCDDLPYAIAKCECNDMVLKIDLTFEIFCTLQIFFGSVLFVNATPSIYIEWGNFTSNDILPIVGITGLFTAPYNNDLNFGLFSKSYVFNIANCDVKESDELYIKIGINYKAAANTQASPVLSSGQMNWRVNYKTFRVEIKDLDCLSKYPKVGDTNEYVFAVHEALSTLVEHYTNNCLRVKSCYFGRPNSMEGANDDNFQKPHPSCDPFPITPYDSGLPIPTFDPVPFQTIPNDGCSCAGWTVVTSGIILRQMGKWMFISFRELYDGLDSIYNIGVGYSEDDRNVLRIEPKEYFYKKDVLLSFDIDYKKSGFKRVADSSNYFNNFKTGYSEDVEVDSVKPYDDIFGQREHSIPVQNAKNQLEKPSSFIASGYAIEYQRRTRLSDNHLYDEEHFIVCVGRTDDQNFFPNMWEVETGVSNPNVSSSYQHTGFSSGLSHPNQYYNFRIRPLYNIYRWLNMLRMSLWKKVNPYLKFLSGTMNISIGGSEPGFNVDKCDCGYNYNTNNKESLYENSEINIDSITYPRAKMFIYPEIVELEHPITFNEFYLIRCFPYNALAFNNELFYIKEIDFKINKPTKFKLIKAVV